MGERPAEREDVEDLDVPAPESESVKGGALNAYITQVKGEKQGELPAVQNVSDVTLKRG